MEGRRSPSKRGRLWCCAMNPEPVATYRLQLRPGFGFEDAAAIASYLRDLGVSHLHPSPYL